MQVAEFKRMQKGVDSVSYEYSEDGLVEASKKNMGLTTVVLTPVYVLTQHSVLTHEIINP